MFKKINKSIFLQFMLAIVVMGAISVAISISIQNIGAQSVRLLTEKNRVVRLIDAVTEIGRSSEIYQSNAARDYESYYRDLEVYYKVIISQLALIDNSFKALEDSRSTILAVANAPFSITSKEDSLRLLEHIQDSNKKWQAFQKGLNEKFGDNTEEPRLEWGAEFIVENVGNLNSALAQMGSQFSTISEKQLTLAQRSAQVELYSIVTFIIAIAVFFYFRISNPINKTKKAFLRVSNGDFGHQIESSYNNEVGQLVDSFNEMSSRSQTVLSILGQLQTAQSAQQILQLLHEHITDYTGCDLVAMITRDQGKNIYSYQSIAPAKDFKNLVSKKIIAESQASIKATDIIYEKSIPINMSNIRDYLETEGDLPILSNLVKLYPLKSAIVFPVKSVEQQTFLILSSYHESKLNQQHMELLLQLMPFIEYKFASIEQAG